MPRRFCLATLVILAPLLILVFVFALGFLGTKGDDILQRVPQIEGLVNKRHWDCVVSIRRNTIFMSEAECCHLATTLSHDP